MRLAIIITCAGARPADIEALWSATARRALDAGHHVFVSHRAAVTDTTLDALRQQGAQLQQRPAPSRSWAARRRKPTRAALGAFAPHAVLVVQDAAYDIAAPDHSELRETLLQERFCFALLCPGSQPPAPTAKTLRDARTLFGAAALCAFQSAPAADQVRSHLSIPLSQSRVLPVSSASVHPAEDLLQWLQSIAGRRRPAIAASATPTVDGAEHAPEHAATPSNTVHMFWHGPALSRLERLCMSSFLAHGHEVHLHAYQALQGVPRGVQLQDANRVLSERHLFRHTRSGSVAAFADWFRYVLLYERGGLWVDTDMVCLQPLRYPHPIVFARQDEQIINNAVLGLPPRHELAAWMIDCCEFPNRARPYDKRRTRRRKLKRRLFQGNQRGNIAWGENGPLGFTQAARHLGYDQHALPFWHFYPVHFLNWRTVFEGGPLANPSLIAGSNALHLWNEMVRRAPGFHGERRFDPGSLFEQLCARYLTSDS